MQGNGDERPHGASQEDLGPVNLLGRGQSVDRSVAVEGLAAAVRDLVPLVAQGRDFETLSELDEQDKEVLRDEIKHKWNQPVALYLTIIMCSVGAAVQYVSTSFDALQQ